jgi:hypothetical protein
MEYHVPAPSKEELDRRRRTNPRRVHISSPSPPCVYEHRDAALASASPKSKVTSHAQTARGPWRGAGIYRGRKALKSFEIVSIFRRERFELGARAGNNAKFQVPVLSLLVIDWEQWTVKIR